MTAASIRTNNPGAMWGGSHAKRWGATDDLILKDGQSNHIAVFPTKVDGAAAQFDLWRRGYLGLSLAAAIKRWCGGNSSTAYVNFLTKHTGIEPSKVVTVSLLCSATGIALMKAQAQWEAGQPYPMTDAEWAQAQQMVFAAPKVVTPPKPVVPKAHPAEAPVGAAAAATAVVVAAQAEWPWWAFVTAILVAAGGVIAVIRYFHNKKG